jgi:hypothetical protein
VLGLIDKDSLAYERLAHRFHRTTTASVFPPQNSRENPMNAIVTSTAASEIVTLDRRRNDRRKPSAEVSASGAETRHVAKKYRRRHIDPTTCERDYRQDELDFMRAMDDYKRSSGRMFPTCSEVLEVVRSMGYVRLNAEQVELLGDTIELTPEPFSGCDDAEEDFDIEQED